MVLAQDIELAKTDDRTDITILPSNLYSDEPTLETDLHLRQILCLLSSLEWLWQDRMDFFASGNLTVYYSPKKIKNRDFRGPDFFVVLDTERRTRRSWTVWEEDGKYPNLIVEILSDSTAKVDRTTKKKLYQDTFRTPEYFWIDPHTLEYQGFVLVGGTYEAIEPNEFGWLWSRQLELYLGIKDEKLRYFTRDGVMVPMPAEAAMAEKQKAEVEKQKAEVEKQKATVEKQKSERLAAKLRELGIDPDTV